MRSTPARPGTVFVILFISFLFILFGVATVCAQTSVAKASSLAGISKRGGGERVTLEAIARASDVVAVGKVARLKSDWNENKSRIQTRVTIQVERPLKGDAAGAEMTVVVPGGEVDGVGEVYSHTDRFRQDEEVVVFAKRDNRGTLRILSGEPGKLLITRDPATGKRIIENVGTLDDVTTRLTRALKESTSGSDKEQ